MIFGGGRWSRVLLSVLKHVRSIESEILWVTKHSFAAAETWLSLNPIENLQVVSALNLQAADAVIIATSPESHFLIAKQAVTLGLPTLCEKPIAPDRRGAEELLELSRRAGCPLGLHLELLYASYLSDFAARLRTINVHSVKIEWFDPWCEKREEETKYGEFYADIMNDQLPHCWSLLATVFQTSIGLQIKAVDEDSASTKVSGTWGSVITDCHLSRRAERRVRRILINDGEWELDFSVEPGVVIHEGTSTPNHWSSERPLARSLSGFLEVARDPRQCDNWPLALSNCFPAVESAMDASARLRFLQDQRIQALRLDLEIDLENANHVRLIVDRFLPDFASKGKRMPVRTAEEQREFARFWRSERR